MSRPSLSHVVRRRWTRRDLMKVVPVAAAGSAALGLGLLGTTHAEASERVGTCRFCLMHCGVKTTLRGTRLVKVEGDPRSKTRGFLCEHGYALRELVHSHERLHHPLVRRGDAFHEVSWDDALEEVARRLETVKARWGGPTLAIQTGWPLVRHPLVGFLHRFARAFGSPNVATVASLCEASARMGQALTVGTKYAPDVRNLKTLVTWGANPAVTAPPLLHLVAGKAKQGNLVVIDPVRTALAKEATVHLPVRPGTDGALALGFIHVLLRDGRVDRDFVQRHTEGFEALDQLVQGYPPARVAAVTGLPAEQIEHVARLLHDAQPTGIWQGLGVEHHENGVQTVRAISSLEVLCGRFDGSHEPRSLLTPVTAAYPHEMLPALYRLRTPRPVPPPVAAKALGSERFPLFEVYNREAHGEVLADAILDGRPYPVRALLLWASNALLTSSGTRRLERAAEALELLVVVDPFLSVSARRADVVLPAATFAESLDIDADDEQVGADSLVPPQGEAWPDYRILRELARAVGLGAYFPWETFHEAMGVEQVPWMQDEASQPRPEAAEEGARFGTVTGKVEFASPLLKRFGYPPLPEWTPPSEETSEDFPLVLVTGPRPRARINSQFSQSPSVRARLREPEVLVHPTAAAKVGLRTGERVEVVSPHGRITLRAVVTDDVHPDCVVLPAGWEEANANLLIDAERRDPISGFPAFRSGVCRLEPERHT